jgi:hypothetical protein
MSRSKTIWIFEFWLQGTGSPRTAGPLALPAQTVILQQVLTVPPHWVAEYMQTLALADGRWLSLTPSLSNQRLNALVRTHVLSGSGLQHATDSCCSFSLDPG